LLCEGGLRSGLKMFGRRLYGGATTGTTIGLTKAKVAAKYRVTIPREVRDKTGLRIGDELLVRVENEKIVMERPTEIQKLAGSWDHIESAEKFMKEVRGIWKAQRMT